MAMRLERILLGNSQAAGPSRLRVMKVDVTSDFTCPFCLLAIKQLQLAVAKYNTIHFHETLELRYRFLPYQLNPALTEDPVPRMDHWRKKFGDKKAEAVRGMVEEKLRTVGYETNFDRCEVSSTHLAHRLMTYALRNDPTSQLPLAMNLFEAHHQDGQHLSDRDFLTYQAMLFNLFPSGAQARQWLESDECDAEVRRAYASAHRLGVTGVPFFVFQQKYAASGAMGVDEFVKLLEEIGRREDLSPAPTSASSPTSTHGTSTLGGLSSSDKHRHAAHINHHRPPSFTQQHQHQNQLPPINGSKHRHHPYPYRSRSPGSESQPRLPSPLGPGVYKNPSPPHAYPPIDVVGYPYNSSRSPASTGYSGTSPGVSAERSTAGIGI